MQFYVASQFPTKATGIHFNQRGHSVSDVRITILEKMKTSDESYRKGRERYLINKFNTYYKGINKKRPLELLKYSIPCQNANFCSIISIFIYRLV
jgi:hypothetical protein